MRSMVLSAGCWPSWRTTPNSSPMRTSSACRTSSPVPKTGSLLSAGATTGRSRITTLISAFFPIISWRVCPDFSAITLTFKPRRPPARHPRWLSRPQKPVAGKPDTELNCRLRYPAPPVDGRRSRNSAKGFTLPTEPSLAERQQLGRKHPTHAPLGGVVPVEAHDTAHLEPHDGTVQIEAEQPRNQMAEMRQMPHHHEILRSPCFKRSNTGSTSSFGARLAT